MTFHKVVPEQRQPENLSENLLIACFSAIKKDQLEFVFLQKHTRLPLLGVILYYTFSEHLYYLMIFQGK